MARRGMPWSHQALFDATKKRAQRLETNGKPVDFTELIRMEPDGGVTNIRNVTSKHWTRWLGPEHCSLVPFTSFSEFNRASGGNIWFAFDETRPLTLLRRHLDRLDIGTEGQGTNDLFGFLTTEPNAEVGKVHPKTMPVILTRPDELEQLMTVSVDKTLRFQRSLADNSLSIVAIGTPDDQRPEAA